MRGVSHELQVTHVAWDGVVKGCFRYEFMISICFWVQSVCLDEFFLSYINDCSETLNSENIRSIWKVPQMPRKSFFSYKTALKSGSL